MKQYAFVVCVLFIVGPIYAADPPVSAAELGQITGYPADKIVIEDGTAETNRQAARKKRPLCLSHHYYHGMDESSFASISIAIGKLDSALPPELSAKYSHTLEAPAYSGSLRKVDLGGGIKGFSGITMAGGGGSIYRGVVSLQNVDRDIQVTVSIGEEGLTALPGTEAYRNAVLDFEGMNAIIEKCLTRVSHNLIAASKSGTSPAISATPTAGMTKPDNQHQEAPPKAANLDTGVLLSQKSFGANPWWAFLILLVVLVPALIFVRKRPPN